MSCHVARLQMRVCSHSILSISWDAIGSCHVLTGEAHRKQAGLRNRFQMKVPKKKLDPIHKHPRSQPSFQVQHFSANWKGLIQLLQLNWQDMKIQSWKSVFTNSNPLGVSKRRGCFVYDQIDVSVPLHRGSPVPPLRAWWCRWWPSWGTYWKWPLAIQNCWSDLTWTASEVLQ